MKSELPRGRGAQAAERLNAGAGIKIPRHGQRTVIPTRDRPFVAGRMVSFRAALDGVLYTIRTQPNAWIELAALIVVVAAGIYFGVTVLEWAVLGATMCGVLALEAVNTAVEAVVDLVSPEYHPLAKIAKDAAAGAMVFAVIGSIVVAAAIFGPRLYALL